MSRAPVFADRDPALVVAGAARAARMMVSAMQRPTYVLAPCEIDGIRGLYGKDVFNRSAFRRSLRREGVSFSADQCIVLQDGVVSSEEWGEFDPRFAILPDLPEEEEADRTRPRGGWLVFELSTFRIGGVTKTELRDLISLAARLRAVGSVDAAVVVDEIRRVRAGEQDV